MLVFSRTVEIEARVTGAFDGAVPLSPAGPWRTQSLSLNDVGGGSNQPK